LHRIKVIMIKTPRDALAESAMYRDRSHFSLAAKAIGWTQFPTGR
jgi:hypothetical protein